MKSVIVYRSHLLPPSETFIRQQALALRKWRPIIVGEHRTHNGLDLSGLDVRLLGQEAKRGIGRIHRKLCRMLWQPYLPITKQIEEIDGNLIHVHFGTDGVDLWPQVRSLARPMLVTLHGYDINVHREWWEAGFGGLHRRNYPERLLHLAQQPHVSFIAVSDSIQRRAIEYGIPPTKITVSYLGVDTHCFAPSGRPIVQRAKRVLFVGRLVEKKGAAYLIRAFAQVHHCIPDAELEIIGDGPLRTDLERLASGLNVPVRFLGALTNREVMQHMHLARVFCLPSVTAENGDAEGLPIVILEAQAAGLPVITSARGGVGEAVVDGETGYTFAERDIDHLGKLIIDSMVDDDALAHFAASARAHVKSKFDIGMCIARLESLYSNTVSPNILTSDRSDAAEVTQKRE